MRSHLVPLILAAAVASVASSSRVAAAASYSWAVASGDWAVASSWTPAGGPPGPSDDATIANGGTATASADVTVATLTLSNGGLTGAANLTVAGLLTWSGGTMSGAGSTNANGGMVIGGSASKTLSSRTLANTATATWTGSAINITAGGTFNNLATATFDAQNDSTIQLSGGGSATFNNAGVFRKSAGAGTTAIGNLVGFNNSGTVDVQTGTLSIVWGGTHTGAFTPTGGTTLRLSGPNTLTAAASIGGAGTLEIVAGATVTHAGSVAMTGPTVVSGGALTLDGTASMTTLALSGGGVGGSGVLTVSGLLTWSGGSMSGSGVTNANGGISFEGATIKTLAARTLNNAATATWAGASNMIFINSGGVLNNLATGLFDAQSDNPIQLSMGPATFNNAGVFRKSAGAGTTTVGGLITFINSGTVEAQSGTLTFNSSYTQTAGTTRPTGGVITSASTMNIQGGSLAGSGALTAPVNVSTGTLAPGVGGAGQLAVTGAYTQGAAGTYAVEIGGLAPGTQFDRATFSGAATLAGTLAVTLINGYEPNVGDTFQVMTFGSRTGDFTTTTGFTIGNGKAFQKNVSGSSIVLEVVTAPTVTPTPTATPSPTATETPTATATPTPTASETGTPTPTVTATETPTPSASPTPVPLSHFTCYQAKTTQGTPTYFGVPNPPGVGLDDRFWSSVAAVKKTTRLCAPTQKNSEPPPAAPDEHLVTYQVKPGQKFTKVLDQVVTDQLGARHYDVLKPAEVMVVSALDPFAIPLPPVNPFTTSFQCYKLKDRKDPGKFAPVQVSLADAFQTLEVLVKKPVRLCTPVSLDGGDPTAPTNPDHLLCYQVKDLKQPAFAPVVSLGTNNQLSPQWNDARKVNELCMPATVSP